MKITRTKVSKKYSTALKLSQFSEKPKNEFKYDIGFIGAGTGFKTPPKLPQKNSHKNSLFSLLNPTIGNMGYAIAEGFKMANPNLKILASDSNWNLNRIQKWNDIGSNQTQKNDQILENCRLVVLSVKPQSIQVGNRRSRAMTERFWSAVP